MQISICSIIFQWDIIEKSRRNLKNSIKSLITQIKFLNKLVNSNKEQSKINRKRFLIQSTNQKKEDKKERSKDKQMQNVERNKFSKLMGKANDYSFVRLLQIIIDSQIFMHTTKNIEKIRENELKMGVSMKGSWHADYTSAYIFIGNLDYRMNEGDVVIVFSEFGQVVDIRLIRDKITGKSKGYGFLAYQDQRSTILAVDNFNGAQICGRILRVDHIKKYKPPKQFLQLKQQTEAKEYRPTGPDGRGWGKFRQHTQQQLRAITLHSAEKNDKKQLIRKQLGKQ